MEDHIQKEKKKNTHDAGTLGYEPRKATRNPVVSHHQKQYGIKTITPISMVTQIHNMKMLWRQPHEKTHLFLRRRHNMKMLWRKPHEKTSSTIQSEEKKM
jgi:hypothetical protein